MNFSPRVGEEGRETALRKKGPPALEIGAGGGLTVAERSGKSRSSFWRGTDCATGRRAEGIGWAGG